MNRKLLLLVVLLTTSVSLTYAQLTPFNQWTLLPQNQMDEIIGESSGETAVNHVIEMVGYQRNRPTSEYSGNLREAQYVLDKLGEYGISTGDVERFKSSDVWDGISGELWEIEPRRKKLADYDDIALMLAEGSKPTDVKAELIWVEDGTEDDFDGLDVNGKIVVTSGSMGRTHSIAIPKGAVGVVSFGNGRELKVPLAIPSSGIRGDNATFGFYLPPREGYKLRDRLIKGETIKVHAVVESQMVPSELQVPTCVIKGTDENAEEIILSGHIFEGLVKQGANDNMSGSAAILEVARLLNQLFEDGRLERPRRSIRFVWIPEYSGTIPWVNAHRDIVDKTLCNINLDMVGINLKSNDSYFSLMRTTYGNPHYINDVLENYFVYVGESNREILANRRNTKIANPIIAPSGSEDAFLYQIEQHYGSSDHEVFNHWSTHVPGVMLITWPDLYYHTSEDLPNKLDATQMKRAIVIAAAGAYTIAAADEKMAISIAGNVFANSAKRLGVEVARSIDELNKTDKENFASAVKRTKNYLEMSYRNEYETLLSVNELAPDSKVLASHIKKLTLSLAKLSGANMAAVKAQVEISSVQLGAEIPSSGMTDLERVASKLIPAITEKAKKGGFGVEREISKLSSDIKKRFPYYGKVANSTELCCLINGHNSALEIKHMMDTQLGVESDLQSVMNYIELLKRADLVELL